MMKSGVNMDLCQDLQDCLVCQGKMSIKQSIRPIQQNIMRS